MPRARPDGARLEWRRGRWYILYWEGSERRRISTAESDQGLARQALADFENDREQRPVVLSVAAALDRYVAFKTGKVAALGRLKDAAGAIKIGLGHLRVDQADQRRWDEYARSRVTRPPRRADPATHIPRKVSTGTLRREFNVLRAALRRAWKDKLLAAAPVLEPPPDSAPRDRYLTKAEAKRILDACVTPHVRLYVAISLYTGARRGSVLALSWNRVDLASRMIDFQEPGRPLTSKRRAVVPINDSLLAELRTAHDVRQTEHVIEYNGKAAPSGLRWSFQRTCERAGLDWRPTPHHMKHSVVSWLAMDGVPIDQAADWVETDPRTLRRHYRKFDPAYLRSVGASLELSGPSGPLRRARPKAKPLK